MVSSEVSRERHKRLFSKAALYVFQRSVSQLLPPGKQDTPGIVWCQLLFAVGEMHLSDPSRMADEIRRVLRDVSAMLLNQIVIAGDNGFQVNRS